MKHHAKAPSAGSSRGNGSSRRSFDRALATLGASSEADGISAPICRCIGVLVGLCLLLGLPVASASAAACPNEAIRVEQGPEVQALPDCMALEQVSPAQKGGQLAKGPIFSASGDRILFMSQAALGDTTGVHRLAGDLYVASRRGSGWVSNATAPPPTDLSVGWGAGAPLPLSFSPELSDWFVLAATSQQSLQGIGQVYRGALGNIFAPLSPLLTPLDPGAQQQYISGSNLQGASADHSSVYFVAGPEGGTSPVRYLLGDPTPSAGADPNVYLAHLDTEGRPSLQLLARDRDGKVWGGNCGARLGGVGQSNPQNGVRNQGAISADGVRTYFSARPSQPASGACEPAANKLRILERIEGSQGPWIGELFSSECSRPASPNPCSTVNGDDLYQGASVDGTKVYFTTNRQLANADLDGTATDCSNSIAVAGCDVYLYESTKPVGERLIDISAGENIPGVHEAGKEAKVLNGLTAISGDGSHVYFVAEGVLTGENAEHESPSGAAGARNLYAYERDALHPAGSLTFVATLTATDIGFGASAGLWGGEGGTFRNGAYPVPALGKNPEGEETGGDGHVLLFKSNAQLTSEDLDGSRSDLYRYDASSGQLQCVSCRPGGTDGEPFDVEAPIAYLKPPGTEVALEGRRISEDGGTIVFQTSESLLPGASSGESHYYVWREGDLTVLPGTGFVEPPAVGGQRGRERVTVSSDGSEIAFVSNDQLLPSDGDAAADVYVARAGGGYLFPPAPEPCSGEQCQAPFAGQPQDAGSPTESATGSNVVSPPPCSKGRVLRHGKCVKKPRRHKRRHHRHSRQHHQQSQNTRHAYTDRRAAK